MDGRPVSYVKLEYYMLNKPAGVLSATRDPDQPTVLSLIRDKRRKDLFPAGRLDKDTEGLLLITNDGALAHSLLSPKKHVDKRYYAKVAGVVTEEHVRLFAGGLDLGEEKPALPAVLEIQTAGKVSHVFVTLREGCGMRSPVFKAAFHGKPLSGRKPEARRVPEPDARGNRKFKR